MSKKSFVVILGIGITVTFVTTLAEAILNGSVVAGESGFPFRFGSSSLFGGSSTNYPMLLADIAFWFLVIWAIWKLLQKLSKK